MSSKPEQKNVDLTHMPQYIKQAPWYVDQKDQPILTHQRARNEVKKPSIDTWYRKGAKIDQQVTKYRKGACANCGAMTHNTKTCTDRPRKIGAKYSNRDFASDEIIEKIELNYEGKKDRWNGYDPSTYKLVIEEWENLNEEQKKKKEQEIQQKLTTGKTNDSDSSDEDDPDREDLNEDQSQFANKDPRVRTTIRNLRIREDTAKYLRNLDPNSAVYDGKTRTMKENPNPELPENRQAFKGDNFHRVTGDFITLMNQEGFVLEATQMAGVEVNNIAMPSQVEIMHKQFKEKSELLKNKKMQELLSRYGGDQHLVIPEELREGMKAELEDLAEQQKMAQKLNKPEIKNFDNKGLLGIKSKYEEDVYVYGHQSVWGSYWHAQFGWGYRCCYSFDKKSKCKGEEQKKETIKKEYEFELQIKKQQEHDHKKLVEETNKKYLKQPEEIKENVQQIDIQEDLEKSSQLENKQVQRKNSSSNSEQSSSESEVSSESDESSGEDSDSSGPRHKKKKRQAKTQQKEDKKQNRETKNHKDQKEGYYGLKWDDKVTEEEMEQYKRQREQFDDPMRQFATKK